VLRSVDFDDGDVRHIGRIGMFDERRRLRAAADRLAGPARAPFYLATAASPEGYGYDGTSAPDAAGSPSSTTRCST
jgi:hypothetical protein